MAHPPAIEANQLQLLNGELPTAYRCPSDQLDEAYIITTAAEIIRGTKLLHIKQGREIEALQNSLATERAANKDLEASFEKEKEAIKKERMDYQFCVMQLVMFITGEGETRKHIEFSELRGILEKVKEGRLNIQHLADEIETKFPVDREAVQQRQEKWVP